MNKYQIKDNQIVRIIPRWMVSFNALFNDLHAKKIEVKYE